MKNWYYALWFQVMTAMLLGLVVGLILSPLGLGLLSENVAEQAAPWIALPGNLFLALIIGVDRILDMTRTTVNVTGDLTASVVMNRLLKGINE